MANGRIYYRALDVPANRCCSGGRFRLLVVHWVCTDPVAEPALRSAVTAALRHVDVRRDSVRQWQGEQRYTLRFPTALQEAHRPANMPTLRIPSAELLVECANGDDTLLLGGVMRAALDGVAPAPGGGPQRFEAVAAPAWDQPTPNPPPADDWIPLAVVAAIIGLILIFFTGVRRDGQVSAPPPTPVVQPAAGPEMARVGGGLPALDSAPGRCTNRDVLYVHAPAPPQTACDGGCREYPFCASGAQPVKGQLCVLPGGEEVRAYFTPLHPAYALTELNPAAGDLWFCTEEEAQQAGFLRAR